MTLRVLIRTFDIEYRNLDLGTPKLGNIFIGEKGKPIAPNKYNGVMVGWF